MSEYLKIERIEFVVTNRCNSHCRHCLVDAAKRKAKPAAVSIELAIKAIKEITGKYSPSSIMTFGGEPMLYPEAVYAIHQTAKDCGIGIREIITNAGWRTSGENSRLIASKLSESGVTNMCISVDAFHQEYIPIDVVKHNVRALVEAGLTIEWNPCWVISREHDNQWNTRTRSILGELKHLSVPESSGNIVQPAGNALQFLREFMPVMIPFPSGSCEDVPYSSRLDRVTCISIEPDGNMLVCREFSIGNAGTQNIADTLESYNPHNIPEMEAILQGGIAGLEEYAAHKGISTTPGGYYSICDKCLDLMRQLRGIKPDPN